MGPKFPLKLTYHNFSFILFTCIQSTPFFTFTRGTSCCLISSTCTQISEYSLKGALLSPSTFTQDTSSFLILFSCSQGRYMPSAVSTKPSLKSGQDHQSRWRRNASKPLWAHHRRLRHRPFGRWWLNRRLLLLTLPSQAARHPHYHHALVVPQNSRPLPPELADTRTSESDMRKTSSNTILAVKRRLNYRLISMALALECRACLPIRHASSMPNGTSTLQGGPQTS